MSARAETVLGISRTLLQKSTMVTSVSALKSCITRIAIAVKHNTVITVKYDT